MYSRTWLPYNSSYRRKRRTYQRVLPTMSKRTRTYAVERYNPAKRRRQQAAAAAQYRFRTGRGGSPALRNVRTGGYLGIENKFYDTSKTGTALVAPADASGAEFDPTTGGLNTVAQGDGESNRDGRNIAMHSIHINGTIFSNPQANQTATDQPGIVYIALVQDLQTNGAQLNSEDVFTNPSGQTYLAASPFRNLQYTKRFRVLKTKVYKLPNPNIGYDGTNMEQQGVDIPFKMNVQLGGQKVNFSGTTAAIANIVDNSLHFVAYCSSTDLAPAIAYNARLRFSG